MMKVFTAATLAVELATACGSGGKASAPPSSDSGTIYTIAVRAQPTGPQTIHVQGTTNLPDGSDILIGVARPTTSSRTPGEGFPSVGSASTSVTGGSYQADIAIDDNKFVSQMQAFAQSGDPLTSVSDEVEVDATFATSRGQTAAVLKVVGQRGEALASSPDVLQVLGRATPPYAISVKAPRARLPFAYRSQLGLP